MMRKVFADCCPLLLAAACSTPAEPKPEILGVRLGMSREQASRTYTQEFPERDGRPGFVAQAIGSDPTYLKYYSVKRTDPAK